ncbi:MAG: hypothetical protein EP330_02570 [Deltaproteobacteria bacterium]|nr:MAG: hypothetical protein EP330_02570 [Deltaproteobacteria bacterium]
MAHSLTNQGSNGPVHASDFGLAAWWGIVGVHLTIGNAIVRLGAKGVDAMTSGLSAGQWALLVVWVAFMLYSEGYRGFHLRYSPMVVARAKTLKHAPLLHKLLAPAYVMGLFHATLRRKIMSYGVIAAVSVVVMFVRQLDQPWRGIVDVGVVLGLLTGLASISYWAFSDGELVSAELPEK